MKIKIEQITILIVLILLVIAALIMIGYRRVLNMEERIEGLEKVLLAVKKGVDFEHSNNQHIIDPPENIINRNNDMVNNSAPNLNNFFQQNFEVNNQVNEDDNISIHSLSDESDFDDDACENEIISEKNEINNNENNISEMSDYDESEESEESDNNEENDESEGNDDDNQINEDNTEILEKSNGLDILMNEEKVNPVRNKKDKDIDIYTVSIEELNNNFKRPELFNLCAIHKIKVNKREDKKGDLINRIMEFQKKNVST